MSFFGSTDFLLEVGKGNVPGHETFNLRGSNPLVGTTLEDVWDPGGVLVYPTANESWELVSADVNDTAAGTGAQEVTIRYLDDTYAEQTAAVVATNGGTVSTGITDGFRLIDMRVTAAGSSAENEGDLTLQVTGGGNTRGQINFSTVFAFGENRNLDAHYTVPLGKTAILISFFNDINKNEDCHFYMRRTAGDDGIFKTMFTSSVYQSEFGMNVNGGSEQLDEKTDLKITCVSSNTNAIATIFAQLLVIDNDKVNQP